MKRMARTLVALVALVGCALAQAQEQTTVEESLFALVLPGKWHGGYDRKSDSWQYRSADGKEAVTVGVLPRRGGGDHKSIKADAHARLEAQRKAEAKLGGPKLRLGKPEIRDSRSAVSARYVGVDPGRNRRTFTRIIANEVAVGSFYYEASGLSAARFDARAKIVLGKVGLIGE